MRRISTRSSKPMPVSRAGRTGGEFNKPVHAGGGDPGGRRRTPPGHSARVVLPAEQSARRGIDCCGTGRPAFRRGSSPMGASSLPKKYTDGCRRQLVEFSFQAKLATLDDQKPGELAEVSQKPVDALLVRPNPDTTKHPEPFAKETGVAVVAWRRRPFACATATTANSFPPSHAWCAAVRRPMPTICVLLSLGHSAERSVMSSLSRCVALTIASCTGMATRLRGGGVSKSNRCRSRIGCGSTRGSMAQPRRQSPQLAG